MADADPSKQVVLRRYPSGWIDVVNYNDKYRTVVFTSYKDDQPEKFDHPGYLPF